MSIDKYRLLGQGLFPETLPPCFDGSDLRRSLRGIVPSLRGKKFYSRSSSLVSFSGTKHDGSRRIFSTPNPIQLFHVCEFINEHWQEIDRQIDSSPFVVSKPRPASATADRPIIIPSLSNLTTEASEKLRYSPIIVKADISQFFPSIYTHSIPWVAHGKEASKADTKSGSSSNYFNSLDYFVRHCQNSETRGVGVGTDAFRIIAEFIGSDIDRNLSERAGDTIIGGARHVDDFFLGVRTEADAQVVLSALRGVLSDYHFQVNDSKTKIISGLEPLNESWAQDLRKEVSTLGGWLQESAEIIRLLNKSTELASELKTDSPVKIFLRGMDDIRVYRSYGDWDSVEPYLQRICFHHNHCIDYIFLLAAKRYAHDEPLDSDGWLAVCEEIISRSLALGHDHELIWSLWLMIVLGLDFKPDLLRKVCEYNGVYSNSILIAAYADGKLPQKPSLSYGNGISSDGGRWLEGLIARSSKYSKARVTGAFAAEFTHLATRELKLIDFDKHIKAMAERETHAISHTRYGYDSDDEDEHDGFEMDEDEDFAF